MEKQQRPRPKKTEVSIRGDTYKLLQEEAAKRGCRVTELVAFILHEKERGDPHRR